MVLVRPQVLITQEYTNSPTAQSVPLQAHISGPNALLHRYSVAGEKANINVGAYNPNENTTYSWPGRAAGSLVDSTSPAVFIDGALLQYFQNLIGNTTGGYGTNRAVAGHANWLRNDTVAFRTNGANARSSLLGDRDVQIGDTVHVRGTYTVGGTCHTQELWTTVAGFAADAASATILPAMADKNNPESLSPAFTATYVSGGETDISLSQSGWYHGMRAGYLSETYTVTVVQNSTPGCTNAVLNITSASGTDNQSQVTPAPFGSATPIGTRGLSVTFSHESSQFVAGQVWTIAVSCAYIKVCAEAGTTFNGDFSDTYVITVTRGGLFEAGNPQISVTTARGLDSSGPTIVSDPDTMIPIGTQGLTIKFGDCSSTHSLSAAPGSDFAGDVIGLRTGDKFYIPVIAGVGPIKTLVLTDDIPSDISTASSLDLTLFLKDNIQVSAQRLSSPPNLNYTFDNDQITVNAGITAYDPTWTFSGMQRALPVVGGTVFTQYNEFVVDLVGQLNFITSVADIDNIPGPLDVANPLKWGVYKALAGANGSAVGYTAVRDPNSLDDWATVIPAIDGSAQIYNYVPQTYNPAVISMFQTQANTESSPSNNNWKGVMAALQYKTTKQVVGPTTSSDGGMVLATLADNPNVAGTQYTLLSVPANNAKFITNGVKAGDVVNYLYTVDAFGNSTNAQFVVNSVLSENSLVLLTGNSGPITVAERVEIWHTLTKAEIVADLIDQAGAYSDHRVCAIIPQQVSTAGVVQQGYVLAATLAGMVSGVVSQQSLTNVTIPGYDDLTTYTTKFFSNTQLTQLMAGGVWVCTQTPSGTPYTIRAVTTDTSDLKHVEEMYRRNVDFASYYYLSAISNLVGKSNATPAMLQLISYLVTQATRALSNNAPSALLGSTLISGSIALDNNGSQLLYIDPLAADHVVVVLSLTFPAPMNNLELYLEV